MVLCCVVLCYCVVLRTPTPLRVRCVVLGCVVLCYVVLRTPTPLRVRCVVLGCVPVYDLLDLLCRIEKDFCQFNHNIPSFPKVYLPIPL